MQVLGSGGPEINDGRASASYLLWRDGKARVLIDMGGGSMLRFEESGAKVEDLELILLTHSHVDHAADLPVLVMGAFFGDRDRDMPIYGPSGNDFMPTTQGFLKALFGTKEGAFRYLDRYLVGGGEYQLQPHDVDAGLKRPKTVLEDDRYRISAIGVHHGLLPALAWRIACCAPLVANRKAKPSSASTTRDRWCSQRTCSAFRRCSRADSPRAPTVNFRSEVIRRRFICFVASPGNSL